MAQKCVHKGCGTLFTQPDESECVYHPGVSLAAHERPLYLPTSIPNLADTMSSPPSFTKARKVRPPSSHIYRIYRRPNLQDM